jgi:putative holliday junction resolvase
MLGYMRLLGIDYGTKRVGTALSDESGKMAFPHQVFVNDTELLKNLEKLITDKGVTGIVIGHSLNKEQQPNKIQAEIEELVTDLTLAVGLPIHLQPEQFSTQATLHIQGRTAMTDASAASLILDSFITKFKK